MFIDTLGGLRLKPVKSNNQYDAARNLPAAFFINFKYSKLNTLKGELIWLFQAVGTANKKLQYNHHK